MSFVQGYNPRTGEPFGSPIESTSDAEVDRICEAAARALDEWAAVPAADRAAVLDRLADALDARAESLIAVADGETALGVPRLTMELKRTTNQFRMFGEVLREGSFVQATIDSPNPDIVPPRPDVRRMRRAIGVVAVFSASNFPFALAVPGSDTASALAAGCPVVVKAHSAHPGTSRAIGEVITETLRAAGAPDGLFAIVYGTPAGVRLVQHPAVKAAGFTGSIGGGRALFDLANGRPDPIPFYGELGSINPVVVLPGAAEQKAAEIAQGFAQSLTMGTGQFCTNPGLLFAPESIVEPLADAVGSTEGGAMLNERMRDSYQSSVDNATKGELLKLVASGTDPESGWSVAPRLFQVPIEVFADNVEKLTEETFGPAGIVVTYTDLKQVLDLVPRLPGTLTGTVHAADHEADLASRVAEALRRIAGRLIYNGWPTGIALAWAMHHGGPWPATTNAMFTSIGTTSIDRWLVPVCYQTWPNELLPPELRDENPLGIPRRRDGVLGVH